MRKSSKQSVIGHVTEGSVFDDLGLSPKKAASVKLKADLHRKIAKRAEHYSQKQLQTILSETQSRISQLLRGRISGFTLDMLVYYAEQLGIHSQIKTTQSKMPKKIQRQTPAFRLAALRRRA